MQAARAAAVALATAAMAGCVSQPDEKPVPEVHLATLNATPQTTKVTGIARWSLDKAADGAVTLRGYDKFGAARFFIRNGPAGMEAESHTPEPGQPERVERVAIARDGQVIANSTRAKSRLALALRHFKGDGEAAAQRSGGASRTALTEDCSAELHAYEAALALELLFCLDPFTPECFAAYLNAKVAQDTYDQCQARITCVPCQGLSCGWDPSCGSPVNCGRCDAPFVCADGGGGCVYVCVPCSQPGECGSDWCGTGIDCGSCDPGGGGGGCGSDDDCGDGEYCDGGACVFDLY